MTVPERLYYCNSIGENGGKAYMGRAEGEIHESRERYHENN